MLKDKGVKVPAEPKREKVDKALKKKDKKAYDKAREAAYKAHQEAMKKKQGKRIKRHPKGGLLTIPTR